MKTSQIKKLFFLLALITCSLAINAQQTKLLTAEKHNEYGLIYTLPITAFQVEVVAVKEIKIAGPFSKYSKLFTADSKVIVEDKINWTIESVRITPYGIPDSENRYLMQLKAGATTYIGVADDGMLLSINKEPVFSSPEALNVSSIEGIPVSGKEYLEYVNEDFTSAQSSYKQAQLLAEELQEIRDAKLSLTRGTAETMPTDGRQLEIMLESLDKQEKSLMNAFIGASWKERVVRTFSLIPQKEGRTVVCRFSVTEGIVDADDYSGEPVYLTVNVIEEPELPVDAKGEEKKIPKDAVIYCIPGTAELSLSYMDNPLFSKVYQLSQFGILFGLNPSVFTDKKEPSYAIFDSTTGALKELGTLK